jgi:F-type H+-transporting ATPase subunit delta
MNESKISVRYARALYMAAERGGVLESVGEDVRQLQDIYRNSGEFVLFLQSTVIRKSRKTELLHQLFESRLHPLTMRFLLLLAENRRESRLALICINFIEIIREKQGIASVTVTTASVLSAEVVEDIRRLLALRTGKTIELTERIKPELIGGLVLRIGDLQYDGSIAHQLKKVKESLLNKELAEIKI